MSGSSLTWALSLPTQNLTLSTYVTVSFQDESHFLKNIKTARCRAAMPLLKVSPTKKRREPDILLWFAQAGGLEESRDCTL